MNPSLRPTPEQRLAARAGEPTGPAWTVGWHQAIFEHYRVLDPDHVGRMLPAPLILDRDDQDDAWLSVVSFRMTNMRWRGLVPLPFASTYAQINVRVYVVAPDGTPGVFFLRNYVSNRLAAHAGRALYGMPYVFEPVTLQSDAQGVFCQAMNPAVGLAHRVSGIPGETIEAHEQDPGGLLFFLTERYPLFSRRKDRVCVARMLHPPWPLRKLHRAEQSHGVPSALGLAEMLEPWPDVQCSAGVEVQMWPPRRLSYSL